jgi:hypothetical protein
LMGIIKPLYKEEILRNWVTNMKKGNL